MTFREPENDGDIQLLVKMNQHLIRDEGHRNSMTLSELHERMQGWLAADYRALTIHDNEDTIGYVLFRQDAEWLYLRQFFIVPAFRRKGLGKLAVEKLREDVWSNKRLRLEVLVNNARGVAFWQSVGFSVYSLTMEYKNAKG